MFTDGNGKDGIAMNFWRLIWHDWETSLIVWILSFLFLCLLLFYSISFPFSP